MHFPLISLDLESLENEKSQLIEKANSIRADICRDAQALRPLISQADLMIGLARQFKRTSITVPAVVGLGVSRLVAIVAPKSAFLVPVLKWTRVLAALARLFWKLGK